MYAISADEEGASCKPIRSFSPLFCRLAAVIGSYCERIYWPSPGNFFSRSPVSERIKTTVKGKE